MVEDRSDLGGKELELLPCRKVAALGRFVEVDQTSVGAPGPGFRSALDLTRRPIFVYGLAMKADVRTARLQNPADCSERCTEL